MSSAFDLNSYDAILHNKFNKKSRKYLLSQMLLRTLNDEQWTLAKLFIAAIVCGVNEERSRCKIIKYKSLLNNNQIRGFVWIQLEAKFNLRFIMERVRKLWIRRSEGIRWEHPRSNEASQFFSDLWYFTLSLNVLWWHLLSLMFLISFYPEKVQRQRER